MERWYRNIDSYNDLIDFASHLHIVCKTWGPFPGTITVSGTAYYPMKTKILLANREWNNYNLKFWSKIATAIFSGGKSLPAQIALEVGKYSDKYHENINSPELKAAGRISNQYRDLINDNGTILEVGLHWEDDAFDPYSKPPDTY